MPDLVSQLMPPLEEKRLPELDLPDDLMVPAYDGQSILNVPSSVTQLLGVPPMPAPALREEILAPLGNPKRVVLLLLDALALHRLQRWVAEGKLPVFEQLIEQGLLAPITSITPSTTSAALTTYWTGTPPAQHGISGYEMWIKEYGIVSNMIAHSPISYPWGAGHLSEAGFDPSTFLPVKTFGTHLLENNIQTHAFQHRSIIHSGLSDLFMSDVERHGFSTPTDLWISVRELLESNQEDKLYIWSYWGQYDGISHFSGPDSERAEAEVLYFSQALQTYLIDALSDGAKKDTVFILTADHGQVTTNRGDPHYQLVNHPSLTKRVRFFAGENRVAFLYIQPGQTEAVKEYIERTWPNQFHVLDSSFAVHQGLFGGGEPHPDFYNRTGDLVLLARGNAFLWWHPSKADPLIGRHGGMTREEMLVPFLAARLG